MKKGNFKLVYVPHSLISKEIACYNVMYKGKHIYPKVALTKLKMPLNQIWISKKYKKHSSIILYHELREIEYRAKGYSEKMAHKKAVADTKKYGKKQAPSQSLKAPPCKGS